MEKTDKTEIARKKTARRQEKKRIADREAWDEDRYEDISISGLIDLAGPIIRRNLKHGFGYEGEIKILCQEIAKRSERARQEQPERSKSGEEYNSLL